MCTMSSFLYISSTENNSNYSLFVYFVNRIFSTLINIFAVPLLHIALKSNFVTDSPHSSSWNKRAIVVSINIVKQKIKERSRFIHSL